jgi:DNA polymerase-3 subunit epsilon/CBS domain-containing protein
MTESAAATPLTALSAIVLDTETTGLDARQARIVEIAALRIKGERIDAALVFERRINPGVPIPPETTKVHGIADADVAAAPIFREIAPELAAWLGGRIVIGHTIGFDLALLKREYALAGLALPPRRALDVRLLARLAAPSLAKYDLDGLCAWLGVTVERRHSARGDALATAQVFARLLPKLREQGVRTLAEADAASRRLAEQEARSGGGLMAIEDRPSAEAPLMGFDGFAYRHRVREVMSAPPVFMPGDALVRDAIAVLAERGISSVFLEGGEGQYGIVTERDVLRALAREGAAALDGALFRIASFPVETAREDDHVYRAIGRMTRLQVRHLGVRDGSGRLVGALTPRNLLRQRGGGAIHLGDEIDSADAAGDLAEAFSRLPAIARGLLAEDVDPRGVAEIISGEVCAMTRRAVELCEEAMLREGLGGAPCPFAVLALGSAGRGESLLATDQDNAIVYAAGEAGGAEDRWFETLGTRFTAMLDEAGVPLCKGGVMARNAPWRMSRAAWLKRVERWVGRQNPEDLLNVDIFFDARAVHGDAALGEGVRAAGAALAARSPDFLVQLALKTTEPRAAFTLFGGLKTDEHGRVDLKKVGLLPIFSAARVIALRHAIDARGTPQRLRAAAAAGVASPERIETLIAAHGVILGAVLRQQLADIAAGAPLSPRVDPAILSKAERADLVDALKSVSIAVDLAGEGRL